MRDGGDGADVGVSRRENIVRCGTLGESQSHGLHIDHEIGFLKTLAIGTADEVDFLQIETIFGIIHLETGALADSAREFDGNLVAIGIDKLVGFENLAAGRDAREQKAGLEGLHFGDGRLGLARGFFGLSGNLGEAVSEVGCEWFHGL